MRPSRRVEWLAQGWEWWLAGRQIFESACLGGGGVVERLVWRAALGMYVLVEGPEESNRSGWRLVWQAVRSYKSTEYG
jgi:hypothetical protein